MLILHGKETVFSVKKIIMYMKVVRGSRREGLSFPLILQVVLEIFIFSLQGLTVTLKLTQLRSWTRLREGVILGGGKEIMGFKCSNLKLLLKVGIADTQRQQSRCHQKNYHRVWRFLQQGGSPLIYSSTFLPDRSIVFGSREITMWSSTQLSRS